jgi:hypothetical protein
MKHFFFFLLLIPILLFSETISQTYYFGSPDLQDNGMYQTIHFNETHQFRSETSFARRRSD